MITALTIQELHALTSRLQALRHRLEGEVTSAVQLKVSLSEASVALYTATREAEALAKEQHHKR